MHTRRVACGVIGAGWWGTYAHVPALLQHPGAELVAIQTRDRDDAGKVARHFGIPRAFTSAEELIAWPGLEAVVVSSPPHLHYPQARAALLRGLHVLVEKPMTLSATQARELVRLAEQHRRHLLISSPWHYTRHGQEARRLVLDGSLGELRMVSVLMTNPVDHLIRGDGTQPTHGLPFLQPQPGTYSDPAIAGGGQSYAQVSHVAAYLAFVTAARPARVFARYHNDGSRLDIYDAVSIEMDNGCIASVASTGATPLQRRDFEVRIFGTRAILFLELWRGRMEFVPLGEDAATVYEPLAEKEVYPDRAPACNLVDCVLDGAPNLSPGTLGLAAMEVLDAASRSVRAGRNILVRRPPS